MTKTPWSGQKSADPIELRIYPGADAAFTHYEDEGDNYNYENGRFSSIDFNWSDTEKKLTIGDRRGKFPGMQENRTFKIVLVGKGDAEQQQVIQTIRYSGKKQVISIAD